MTAPVDPSALREAAAERRFPIQMSPWAAPHPLSIPWETAELAFSVYAAKYGRGQSLERLAERGGFSAGEMDKFFPTWREHAASCSAQARQLEAMRAALAGAERVLDEVCAWRRAGVGLEPIPQTDAETLGERIDAALSAIRGIEHE